jgi:hypothetical protein
LIYFDQMRAGRAGLCFGWVQVKLVGDIAKPWFIFGFAVRVRIGSESFAQGAHDSGGITGPQGVNTNNRALRM